uniref:Uncharacterized protein n=1 Tax=uncultured marine virus TaxID=186617 RepID=A0A0F7L539_9VIRU|nr:hypothetical protein [uncultured marine virus]
MVRSFLCLFTSKTGHLVVNSLLFNIGFCFLRSELFHYFSYRCCSAHYHCVCFCGGVSHRPWECDIFGWLKCVSTNATYCGWGWSTQRI